MGICEQHQGVEVFQPAVDDGPVLVLLEVPVTGRQRFEPVRVDGAEFHVGSDRHPCFGLADLVGDQEMCDGVSAKVFDLGCGGAREHSGGVGGGSNADWNGPAPTCRLDAVAEEAHPCRGRRCQRARHSDAGGVGPLVAGVPPRRLGGPWRFAVVSAMTSSRPRRAPSRCHCSAASNVGASVRRPRLVSTDPVWVSRCPWIVWASTRLVVGEAALCDESEDHRDEVPATAVVQALKGEPANLLGVVGIEGEGGQDDAEESAAAMQVVTDLIGRVDREAEVFERSLGFGREGGFGRRSSCGGRTCSARLCPGRCHRVRRSAGGRRARLTLRRSAMPGSRRGPTDALDPVAAGPRPSPLAPGVVGSSHGCEHGCECGPAVDRFR